MKAEDYTVRRFLRSIGLGVALLLTLALIGCNANVGVGLSVGVPVGQYGYVSVGGTRWY
jgi:hypothetical protein